MPHFALSLRLALRYYPFALEARMPRAHALRLPSLGYWRRQRGLTQKRLAERIAMRRTTIWRIETGRPCLVRTTRLLARSLNVEVADLISQPPES